MGLSLLIQNSVQQDYFPKLYPRYLLYQNFISFDVALLQPPGVYCLTLPQNFYEKPWEWEKILPSSQVFNLFPPPEKFPLIDLYLPP